MPVILDDRADAVSIRKVRLPSGSVVHIVSKALFDAAVKNAMAKRGDRDAKSN